MKTILVDAWKTFVTEDGVHKEMYDMLERYENQKLILTNATLEQMQTLGIVDMPYEVFSMHHAPDKIDKQYYEVMLDKYVLQIDDLIYFEHSADACAVATDLGIKTYHYDCEAQDIEAVEKFIKSNL